jgi:hypothetical protein
MEAESTVKLLETEDNSRVIDLSENLETKESDLKENNEEKVDEADPEPQPTPQNVNPVAVQKNLNLYLKYIAEDKHTEEQESDPTEEEASHQAQDDSSADKENDVTGEKTGQEASLDMENIRTHYLHEKMNNLIAVSQFRLLTLQFDNFSRFFRKSAQNMINQGASSKDLSEIQTRLTELHENMHKIAGDPIPFTAEGPLISQQSTSSTARKPQALKLTHKVTYILNSF